jgi:hypothetical protein
MESEGICHRADLDQGQGEDASGEDCRVSKPEKSTYPIEEGRLQFKMG